MAYFPDTTQTAYQQDYSPEVIYGTNNLGQYTISQFFLAPATASTLYNPGLIMARYTSGDNAGMVVNWDGANGVDGQEIPIGILVDNFLNAATSAEPPANTAANVLLIGQVYGAPLYATTGNNVIDALVDLQAVQLQTPAMNVAYAIRGTTVSA